MKALRKFFLFLPVLSAGICLAQINGDQLGVHDMSPSGRSQVQGSVSSSCLYCHAPHGGLTPPTGLWNQTLSQQTYSQYTSSTYHQTNLQPPLGAPSKLCLSCHDGTVAPGETVAYGNLTRGARMPTASNLGTDLKSTHPFSLQTPLKDASNLNQFLQLTPPKTADPKVKLIHNSVENYTVECTTCHEPHFQYTDQKVQMFLVRDASNGAICLACHDPNRTGTPQPNYLAGWQVSSHAMATNTTGTNPYVGGYGTVAENSCNSCHMPHNAAGPARLLRGADEQDCASCHAGSNLQPAVPNVYAEFQKAGHPFPTGTTPHDRGEDALLNNNRHATCVDCHNPHASQTVATFTPAPGVRPSQVGVVGINGTDGTTIMTPAANQFENCFRCHGNSQGKVADVNKYGYLPNRLVATGNDQLNVFNQMNQTYGSSHPVTHDATGNQQLSLRANMLKFDGSVGRSMGTRIFCTDCHNSDDNRESGGAGPNGPHGSSWTHILERQYTVSTAASPGTKITNPIVNPDLSSTGPYALCAKCHDLSQVVSNNSTFAQHGLHIVEQGVSCSVCHTAHGMGGQNANISGQRLINFDVNVVAQNGSTPITYVRGATSSCTLTCHEHQHNASGATLALKKARP